MSRYEDYQTVSEAYDETRSPIGAEILRRFLGATGQKLSDIRLLDAGCGTGAYSEALLAEVGRIEAVDLSAGMLSVARAKLATEESRGRIAFHEASIDALPFADDAFDAAMVNQVLHHLEDGMDPTFASSARVFAEMARVLRPGGILVVNMCTREQLQYGYWYYDLLPEAREECIRRHIPAGHLKSMLAAAGFDLIGRESPTGAVMQGAAYFDVTGPLRDSWRKGDSFWALALPGQIAAAEAQVRKMRAAGELDAWFRERDARRTEIGQFTFFTAMRTRQG